MNHSRSSIGLLVLVASGLILAASAQKDSSTHPPQERRIQRSVAVPDALARAHADGTRSPDGSPGPQYWQLRVDYVIHAALDPSTLRGHRPRVHRVSQHQRRHPRRHPDAVRPEPLPRGRGEPHGHPEPHRRHGCHFPFNRRCGHAGAIRARNQPALPTAGSARHPPTPAWSTSNGTSRCRSTTVPPASGWAAGPTRSTRWPSGIPGWRPTMT